MIEIINKTDCCGCSACEQACPKHCISLLPDKEGFWYPQIDKSTCVDCGLCEKVCPVSNPKPERTPLHVYAAVNKNEEIRAKSASGGMFTLIAQKVIEEGGVVFGVKFDEQWNVVFGYTETIEGLEAFRRSKYVQAWVGESYKQAKHFLDAGRKVLFTGVPCQVAALLLFLRKPYENLLTVDLLCEGVPSPQLWKRYLKEEIARSAKKFSFASSIPSVVSDGGVRVTDVSFRNKSNGWKKYSFALSLAAVEDGGDKNSVSPFVVVDRNSAYMQMMFRYGDLRPICYECPFKSCKSQSDITIADYWGITKLHPEMDDDKGTSMVFINTNKGAEAFDLSQTRYIETTYEESWPFNNVVTSSKKHPKRDYFYEHIDNQKSVIKFINGIIFPPSYYAKRFVKTCVKNVVRFVSGEKGLDRLTAIKKRIKF